MALEDYVAAFAEWERRYRDEPDRFYTDAQRLAETVEDLGRARAAYFVEILGEVRAARGVA